MANVDTRQVNMTFVFSDEVLSLAHLKVADLRTLVLEIFESEPVITQFPDVIAVIHPATQTNLLIERNRLIFTNGDLKPFESRDIDKFTQLAIKIYQLFVSKQLVAYGFNYSFVVSTEEQTAFKQNELCTVTSLGILPEEIVGMGLHVTYKREGVRYQIQSIPVYGMEVGAINGLEANCNIHYFSMPFPTGLVDLVAQFRQGHDQMREVIREKLV